MKILVMLFLALSCLFASGKFIKSEKYHYTTKENGRTIMSFEIHYIALNDMNSTFNKVKKESAYRGDGHMPIDLIVIVNDKNGRKLVEKKSRGIILDSRPWGIKGEVALPNRYTKDNTKVVIDFSFPFRHREKIDNSNASTYYKQSSHHASNKSAPALHNRTMRSDVISDVNRRLRKYIDYVSVSGFVRDHIMVVTIIYKNRATDQMVSWEDGSVNVSCTAYEMKGDFMHRHKGAAVGWLRDQVVSNSYQDVYIDIKRPKTSNGLLECHINIGGRVFTATDGYVLLK